MKHLRLRIAVPLVALALLAAACSGTETATPDVAASDNDASDTDTGGTTTDNADAGTNAGDDGNAVADNENLDAYEGLNEGEIESAKREEEVRRVIARAEAADAEAAEAETQSTEPSETDTQSTDTQPEETQPSVPRIDADGTERLGDRAAGYDPKVFRDTRGRAITDRTTVHTDEVGGGGKYFVAEIHNADTGAREAGNRWVYVDARGPLEGKTISRTYNFEAYTTIEGESEPRRHQYKYWNEPVPIRENLDIRLIIKESDVILHNRVFGWKRVPKTQPSEYVGDPKSDFALSEKGKIYEPIPNPEGTGKRYQQQWYVYVCDYAREDDDEGYVEYPAGAGSLRLLRVYEIGTELSLPGLKGGEAWLQSGATGVGTPAGSC